MNFVRSNKKDGRQNQNLQREKAFGGAPDADDGLRVKCGLPPVLENSTARFEPVQKGSNKKVDWQTEICERPKGAWGLPQEADDKLREKLLLLTPSKNLTTRFAPLKKSPRKSAGKTENSPTKKESSGQAKWKTRVFGPKFRPPSFSEELEDKLRTLEKVAQESRPAN